MTGRLGKEVTMAEIARVSVEDARRDVATGRAIFVCAYDDERCRQLALEGSIPLSALAARSATLPKDQPIIFYCA
jgi:rhodanese-related sulfurtransferase